MQPEKFDSGLATRRRVLGDSYVSKSIQSSTGFSADMQYLVTEYCWDEIWNRPGLSREERSLINLAMITALNRPHELATHIRGAVNNGVTIDKIKEVLLQTAIYCGVPAALDSFRTAQETLFSMGIDLGPSPIPTSTDFGSGE